MAPAAVNAHISLDVPKARSTPNLKTAPCGASSPGTPQVIEGWTAGARVVVEYTETIDHPSHYRLALSREGDSAFVDPASLMDKATDGIELLDGIEDLDQGNNRKGTIEVVLPDEPCESCVLQLMQIMYDKPSAPFYYQCADIAIGPAEVGTGSGGGENGSGGESGSGGQPGAGGQSPAGGAAASGGAPSGAGGSETSGATSSGGAAVGGNLATSAGGGAGVGGSSLEGAGGAPTSEDGAPKEAGGCALVGPPSSGRAPLGAAVLTLLGVTVRRIERRSRRH